LARSRKFIWQYFPLYLLILLLSLAFITYYASMTMKRLYLGRMSDDLQARCVMLQDMITFPFSNESLEEARSLCEYTGSKVKTRFTLILPSGEVIGDSNEDPAKMENHVNRPEIQRALSGEAGIFTRYSRTLKVDMMYVAIPFQKDNSIQGVVRSAVPVSILTQTLNHFYRRIAMVGFIVILSATLLSLVLSRQIRKPVNLLSEGAIHFGRGDLDYRLHISDPEEFMNLGNAMNQMASDLNKRIHTITQQRNELEGILTSMIEGVLVVNTDEQLVQFNHAATRFFDVDPKAAKGKSIQEAIRNMDLLRFIHQTLQQQRSNEGDIIIRGKEDRFLQAHGTVILNHEKETVGILVVLNDITRLKRLENIRRDFVANVSHELKTPITAIKGSVETLQGGAIKNPKDGRRFLDIILKHTDRLNAIIEDLLSLSRIEKETEKKEIPFEKGDLHPIVEEAISVCESKASRKKIQIDWRCSEKINIQMNGPMLEQALINLIDNAIKYSEPGNRVLLEAEEKQGDILIHVQDWGCGIPKKHHSRIFERFYRVDKARSRNLGGTGLGLAIVKHVVQAHGGEISVVSGPSQGSRFTLHLPVNHLSNEQTSVKES